MRLPVKILLVFLALCSVISCKKSVELNYTYVVDPGPNNIAVKYNIKYSREEEIDIKANEPWKKDVTLISGDEYYLFAETIAFENNNPGECKIAVLKGSDTIRFASFDIDQNKLIGWTSVSGTARK